MIYELGRYRCVPNKPGWRIEKYTKAKDKDGNVRGWEGIGCYLSTFRNALCQLVEFNLQDDRDVSEAREIIKRLDEIQDAIGRLA